MELPKPPAKSFKEQTDLFLRLAASAQARFLSRRDVEWKVSIGLWTLLAGITAAIFSLGSWPITESRPGVLWNGMLAVGLIILLTLFRCTWLKYLEEAFDTDQRTSYYWESAVTQMLDAILNPDLDPNKSKSWAKYGDLTTTRAKTTWRDNIHRSGQAQFWITCVFALLVWGASVARTWQAYLIAEKDSIQNKTLNGTFNVKVSPSDQ